MVVRCIAIAIAIAISIRISISIIVRGSRSCRRLSDAFQNLDIYNCIPIVRPGVEPWNLLENVYDFRQNKGKIVRDNKLKEGGGDESNQVPLMKP